MAKHDTLAARIFHPSAREVFHQGYNLDAVGQAGVASARTGMATSSSPSAASHVHFQRLHDGMLCSSKRTMSPPEKLLVKRAARPRRRWCSLDDPVQAGLAEAVATSAEAGRRWRKLLGNTRRTRDLFVNV